MGMLARIPKALATLRGRNELDVRDSLELLREIYGGLHESWSGKNVNLRTAMMVSAAFACGRVIAEGLATLPLRVLKESDDGKKVTFERQHPVFDLLMYEPNGLQSPFEFKETLGLHLAFCGNAYVWLRTIRKQIGEMLILEPRWVRVNYNWPQPPTYEVRDDEGHRYELKNEEVWHIKGPSWQTYLGLEFTQIAREALGLAISLEETQARIQGQGVQTSGFIAIDGTINSDQQEKLRSWIEKEHQGSHNAGRPMILDRAAKWVSQAMSNTDAQAKEMRDMQINEVCRFMRVMPIMVGVTGGNSTYASSEQMFLAHLVHTLGPWINRIESSASRWLLSVQDRNQGRHVKFDEKVMQRMTSIDLMNYLQKAAVTGILTRNECRRVLDYNPLDGLDDPLTPVNEVAGEPPKKDDTSPNDTSNPGTGNPPAPTPSQESDK